MADPRCLDDLGKIPHPDLSREFVERFAVLMRSLGSHWSDAELDPESSSLPVPDLSIGDGIVFDLFAFSMNVVQVVDHLNLMLDDAIRLANDPTLYPGDSKLRLHLCFRVVHYEMSRFRDLHERLSKQMMQAGVLDKSELKSARQNVYDRFEPILRNRNLLIHSDPSFYGAPQARLSWVSSQLGVAEVLGEPVENAGQELQLALMDAARDLVPALLGFGNEISQAASELVQTYFDSASRSGRLDTV